MQQTKLIQIEISFDGDKCDGCTQLIHASYGWICSVYDTLIDKTDEGFVRCGYCQVDNPAEEDKHEKNNNDQTTLF